MPLNDAEKTRSDKPKDFDSLCAAFAEQQATIAAQDKMLKQICAHLTGNEDTEVGGADEESPELEGDDEESSSEDNEDDDTVPITNTLGTKPSYAVLNTIPLSIKKDIWSGSYFDLTKLMKIPESDKKLTLEYHGNTKHISLNDAAQRRFSLPQWREAFLKYAACITYQDPSQATALFAYILSIEEMHDDFKGFAWKKYDEEFRMQKAISGVDWTDMDTSLYMKAAAASLASPKMQQPFRGPGGRDPSAARSHRRTVPNGYCRNFAVGTCKERDNTCAYLHRCFKCQQRHASVSCQAHAPQGAPVPALTYPQPLAAPRPTVQKPAASAKPNKA